MTYFYEIYDEKPEPHTKINIFSKLVKIKIYMMTYILFFCQFRDRERHLCVGVWPAGG